MNNFRNSNLKNLLTVVFALVLAMSLVFSVGCGDNGGSSSSSSSSSSTTETKVYATDYQKLANGDFQFGTNETEADEFPVSSGISWTRSNDSLTTSAPTSTFASGVIDTDETVYAAIKEHNADLVPETNPKTPEALGLTNAEDLYFYNEETADENPNDDGLVTSGSKILMIHNHTADNRGTAQKFTSSTTLSPAADAYGKVTVWVNTVDISTLQETEDFGAYIAITNTLSSTRSPFIVKNINTNGAWKQYTIYLQGSTYASSSFKVVLGLGFGSKTVMGEYVEGFAFFDNVHYEEIDAETYATETATNNEVYSLFDDVDVDYIYEEVDAEDLIVNMNDALEGYTYTLTHRVPAIPYAFVTEDDYPGKPHEAYIGTGVTGTEDAGTENLINAITICDSTIENPFGSTSANYIKVEQSGYTSYSQGFYFSPETYLYITFYVKSSVGIGQTGTTIKVEELDGSNKVLNTTAVATNFTTTKDKDADNDGWEKVAVLLKNDTEDNGIFRFAFVLGTTANVTDPWDLTTGYFIATNYSLTYLSKEEFNIASPTAQYKATASIAGEYINGKEEAETNDSYNFNYSAAYAPSIDSEPAAGVIGYTGVVGNHSMVGGTEKDYESVDVVAGVINTKYTYTFLTGTEMDAIKALGKDGKNEYAQPLVIKNTAAATYGYIGAARTFSAGTTTLVTVKVKALDSANAYVYLVNADALEGFNVLSVAGKGYTTDESGKPTLSGSNEFDVPFATKVSASSNTAKDGWVNVNFLVTAGNNDITYRIELWNGSRDGSEQSTGTVVFDQITTSTSTNVSAFVNGIVNDYNETAPTTYDYTQIPTEVTATDDDGNDFTFYRTYNAKTVCTVYTQANTVVATYENIDVALTADETNEIIDPDVNTDDDSSVDRTNGGRTNWALQIVSIIIAIALLIALGAIVIRVIVKKNKKSTTATQTYYNRNSRELAQEKINANKAKRAEAAKRAQEEAELKAKQDAEAQAQAPAQEETPAAPVEEAPVEETEATDDGEEKLPEYDYDNPENNIPTDEQ